MARPINSRLRISGRLVAETPLHVGGFSESADTDLPLAQNGKGEWYVPGTSITGVLRNWCEKNLGEELADQFFAWKARESDRNKSPAELEKKKHASFVLIEDAQIENADEVLAEIRDGVGIDRFYGTAADGAKYDRAVLPRGTELNLEMTVEISQNSNTNQTKAVFGYLLEALQNGSVRFGASKTRGLGRVNLINESVKEQRYDSFEAILNTLNGCGSLLTIEDLKKSASVSLDAAPRIEIKIVWESRLPVMVKAGYDGIGVDMLPLTSSVKDGNLALCLPGSSIKGVLRSHAERIMRTLLDCRNELYRTKEKTVHDQMDAIPLIEELFGVRSKSKDEKANLKNRLGLGALAIDDCYAKDSMPTDKWRKVEVAADARKVNAESNQNQAEVSYHQRELWQRLREIDEGSGKAGKGIKYEDDTQRFKIHHHVAIDRWTGGASDGALYSVLAPNKVDWDEMRLALDFGRIEKECQLPILMLLLLTLRDVAENRLPFGFATNRGMGEIAVKEIAFYGSNLEKIGLTINKGNFAEFQNELKSKYSSEAWKQWLTNIQT